MVYKFEAFIFLNVKILDKFNNSIFNSIESFFVHIFGSHNSINFFCRYLNLPKITHNLIFQSLINGMNDR